MCLSDNFDYKAANKTQIRSWDIVWHLSPAECLWVITHKDQYDKTDNTDFNMISNKRCTK